MERLVAHHDAEEGLGSPAVLRGGARPGGHLDEGVGPALGRGPGQLARVGLSAELGAGRGPVGLEELGFQAAELAGHDRPRDGVEGHLAEEHARDARAE